MANKPNKWESLRCLWFLFKGHKREMSIVLAAMILSSMAESLNLLALYPIINHGLDVHHTEQTGVRVLEWFVHLIPADNLFLASCILLLLLTLAATGARVLFYYLFNRLTMHVSAQNQKAIFDKFLKADYRYFVGSQQGQLIYAGTVSPIGVATNAFSVIRLINSIIGSLFLMVVMAVLAWKAMLFIFFLGLLYVVFIRRMLKQVVNKYAKLSVDEDRNKNVILNEFITGIKSIKAFHTEKYWEEKYKNVVDRSAWYRFKVMLGYMMPDVFLKFSFFTAIGLLGAFLSLQDRSQIMTMVPVFATFAVMASRLIPYVNIIGNDTMAIARYLPDTKIVYDLLNEKDVDIKDGHRDLTEFKESIVLHNVWFQYQGTDDFLFKGIDPTVPRGKMTAVVGSSGSGKSTLVNLLMRLYEPGDGRITIDGTDIREFTLSSYLKKIGYVSQETFIFNGTIRDNIAFGYPGATDEDIIVAAQLANAHDFILETENGYDTIVGDAGVKLSGGQRQRLAIARAILRKPQIFIFDEATSSLDQVSERMVQDAINKISKNTTVLIIAHRLSTVQKANKIIVLDKGTVAEEGTHQELLEKRKSYYQLFSASQSHA